MPVINQSVTGMHQKRSSSYTVANACSNNSATLIAHPQDDWYPYPSCLSRGSSNVTFDNIYPTRRTLTRNYV